MGKKRKKQKKGRDELQAEKGVVEVEAIVLEALGGINFLCKLDNGFEVKAHLGGRVRGFRVVPGDKVRIELSSYDLERGIIKRRLRNEDS